MIKMKPGWEFSQGTSVNTPNLTMSAMGVMQFIKFKGMAKEKAVTDAQERFGDLLAKLRSDGEERVQLVEERSKELATKAADLRDQVYKLEEEKNDREV